MVIGNMTRREESAIHGEQNGKGGGHRGALAAGGKAKVPIDREYLPQTCWCSLRNQCEGRERKQCSIQHRLTLLLQGIQ